MKSLRIKRKSKENKEFGYGKQKIQGIDQKLERVKQEYMEAEASGNSSEATNYNRRQQQKHLKGESQLLVSKGIFFLLLGALLECSRTCRSSTHGNRNYFLVGCKI